MKRDELKEFYRILYDEHSADVRAQNIFLKNFESIDAFLNFNPGDFKRLKDCGKKTAEILKNIQLTLMELRK